MDGFGLRIQWVSPTSGELVDTPIIGAEVVITTFYRGRTVKSNSVLAGTAYSVPPLDEAAQAMLAELLTLIAYRQKLEQALGSSEHF